jgi:GNAT superfamily N-acetyltransferase
MEPARARVVAPEGIRVRPAASEDCDALLALYCEVHDAHLDAHPDEFEALTPEEEARLLHEFAHADPSRLLVAESARGLVGCVRFELQGTRKAGRRARRRAYINLLVVAPRWQAKGVGALLLEHVHAAARFSGIEAVELDVYEFNAAGRRLYERMGYTTVLRRMKHRLDRA